MLQEAVLSGNTKGALFEAFVCVGLLLIQNL